MTDRDLDPFPTTKGISLEATSQRWRLVASTRSIIEALPSLIGGTLTPVVTVGIVWIGLHQKRPLSSFELWFMPLLLVLFLSFFMVFVGLGAMRLLGRIEITIEEDRGTVFTGVGDLGRTQHIEWSETTRIHDEHKIGRGVEYHEIVLRGARTIRTGKFLTKDQASLIVQALREWQQRQSQRDGS